MLLKTFRFIKPSKEMRMLQVLDLVEKDASISQRELAASMAVSSTIVNEYIEELEKSGSLEVRGSTNRTTSYHITDHGTKLKSELIRSSYKEIVQFYGIVKFELKKKLEYLYADGVRRLVLFGAAETGELFYMTSKLTPILVVGIVDSDAGKQGKKVGDITITHPDSLRELKPDAVLISSFGYAEQIYEQVKHLETEGVRVELP